MRKVLFKSMFLGFALAGIVSVANGQFINLDWVQQSGGEKFYALGSDVAVDKDGNTYSTGYFTGTVSFYQGKTTVNSTLKAFGEQDAYIMKHNAKGEIVWIKQFGYEKSYARGVSIRYDVNTELVVVLGEFNAKGGYDTKKAPLESKGEQDIFISALGADGKEVWTKGFGGKGHEYGTGLSNDNDGSIYVTGSFQEKVDWDASHSMTSVGGDDAYALKLSIKEGSIEWTKHLVGGGSTDKGMALVAGNEALFVTGIFSDKAQFDVTAAQKDMKSNGAEDIYLARLEKKDGSLVWLQFFGGNNDDYVYAIATDESEGAPHITGKFSEKVDFNATAGPDFTMEADGKGDVFIAKYGPKGGIVWGKKFGGISRDEGKSIKIDQDGNVYSIGDYLWEVDFNTGTDAKDTFMVRSPGQGMYVHKLTAKGEFEWVRVMESCANPNDQNSQAGSINAGGMALSYEKGSIYATGWFYNTVDFDPNASDKYLNMKGNTDVHLLKLVEVGCANASSITASACDAYTYNGTKYNNSGTYNHIFKNAAGCDSTVTLVLTINKSAATSLTQVACDSYVFDGKTLTSSGTYTQNAKTASGCDSIITLNLTVNKSATNSLKETACDSFSLDNKLYYSKSGTYKQVFKTGKGCDSTVNLDLTVNQSVARSISETACSKYVLGDAEYTESGVYNLDLKTVSGCDSAVTLNLVITKMDRSVSIADKVLTANAIGATYQWLDCDKDMAPIAGETKQYFKPTKNGHYAVEVKKEACTEKSDCYEITGISVSVKELGGYPLSLYPNPAGSRVVVDFGRKIDQAYVKVLNILGQIVQDLPVQQSSLVALDIQQLPKGLYLVEITEGEQQAQLRFVKD